MTTVAYPEFSNTRLPSRFRFGRGGANSNSAPGRHSKAPSVRPWHQSDAAIELGWDHAHYGLRPALEALFANPRLKEGYQAGLATFGRRTMNLTPFVKPWLALRLDALANGRAFDTERVNARYVEQVVVSHCPVTREPLALGDANTVIAPVGATLDYLAGNLVMMSRRACDAREDGDLTADEWARLCTLHSFSESVSGAAASALPLRALPPNRVRIANTIQALQAIASEALADESSRRFDLMRAAMPGKAVRDDVDAFAVAFDSAFSAALALLETSPEPATSTAAPSRSSSESPASKADHSMLRRWAIEDAWADLDVQRTWQRMAAHVDTAQAEAIVAKVGGQHVGIFIEPDSADPVQQQPLPAVRAIRSLAAYAAPTLVQRPHPSA